MFWPMVDGFLILYQLGICCVYIMFVASSIKQVVDFYWMVIDVRIHMVIILLPLILLSFIRNLKRLAPVSQFANIITFAAIGITMYYIFKDLPPMDSVEMVGTASGFILYVGTTLFALEAVGVVIALENNMQTPKSFGKPWGVLNKGMTFIVILYTAVGFFGYIKYGSAALGSVTLNLPNTDILAQSVKLIFAIAIFITYALQGYVAIEIIWNTYLKPVIGNNKNVLFIEYVMRAIIVISTFILAVLIPRLELFISLFGALCLSALGIAFPALIEICVLWPHSFGKFKYILIKDILLFIVGILALFIGTYTSIYGIVKSFQ
uniref:Amino acid transporter transmembrane domain-containing protein n=1 Tax=Clastoptera arizonana TaxID=38151 RepID=A0A1B6C3V7_9HEMI